VSSGEIGQTPTMEAATRGLVAGSHNRNELVVIQSESDGVSSRFYNFRHQIQVLVADPLCSGRDCNCKCRRERN
jgi:hypothetical protein